MKKTFKYLYGWLIGIIVGIICSIFFLIINGKNPILFITLILNWSLCGILISAVDFNLKPAKKGLVVSLMFNVSLLIITFASNASQGLWLLVLTVLLGSASGLLISINKK